MFETVPFLPTVTVIELIWLLMSVAALFRLFQNLFLAINDYRWIRTARKTYEELTTFALYGLGSETCRFLMGIGFAIGAIIAVTTPEPVHLSNVFAHSINAIIFSISSLLNGLASRWSVNGRTVVNKPVTDREFKKAGIRPVTVERIETIKNAAQAALDEIQTVVDESRKPDE